MFFYLNLFLNKRITVLAAYNNSNYTHLGNVLQCMHLFRTKLQRNPSPAKQRFTIKCFPLKSKTIINCDIYVSHYYYTTTQSRYRLILNSCTGADRLFFGGTKLKPFHHHHVLIGCVVSLYIASILYLYSSIFSIPARCSIDSRCASLFNVASITVPITYHLS